MEKLWLVQKVSGCPTQILNSWFSAWFSDRSFTSSAVHCVKHQPDNDLYICSWYAGLEDLS